MSPRSISGLLVGWLLALILSSATIAAPASAAYWYGEPVNEFDGALATSTAVPPDVPELAHSSIPALRDPSYALGPSACRHATNTADDVLRLSTEQSWGNLDTLDDHFIRHGADFGASSADDYAAQASEFFQRAQQQGLPTLIDADGVIRIYEPATNTFGAFNATGTTRTFYTPKRGIDYWLDQPGVLPWSPGS